MSAAALPREDPRRRVMRLGEWPDADLAAWRHALDPGDILDVGGPASGWSSATVRKHEGGYGRWLTFLARHEHRTAIQGETDSEHIFHMLVSAHESAPARPLCEILHHTLGQIAASCHQIDSGTGIGLNMLLTDGERLVGCRWGRMLHYVERVGVHDCEICGFPHIHHDPRRNYRAIVIASEPISNEHWREIPDRSVFAVSPEMALQIDPLAPTEAGEAIFA